jgi:ankyrin repeat protein
MYVSTRYNIYTTENTNSLENNYNETTLVNSLEKGEICTFTKQLKFFLAAGNSIDSLFKINSCHSELDDNLKNAISLLHIASLYDNDSATKLLLEKNANPDINLLDGSTPLHIACKTKHKRIIEILLEYKADTTICNKSGLAPIHIACENDDTNLVSILLEANPQNANILTKEKISPLHIAVLNNNIEPIKLLLEYGADINIKTSKDKDTPLIIACKGTQKLFSSSNKKQKIALFLIERGADINLRNKASWQAIHYVSKNANKDIMEALLSKGANINSKTDLFKGSATPLIVTLENKQHDFANYLALEHDADIYSRGTSHTVGCFSSKSNTAGVLSYLLCISCDLITGSMFNNTDNIGAIAKRTVLPCLRPNIADLAEEGFIAKVESRKINNKQRHTENIKQNSKIISEQPKTSMTTRETNKDSLLNRNSHEKSKSSCFPFFSSARKANVEVIYIGEPPPAYTELDYI